MEKSLTIITLSIFLCVFIIAIFSLSRRTKVSAVSSTSSYRKALILIAKLFNITLKEPLGSSFMSDKDLKKILNPSNTGLLIDGKNLRMKEKESFTHNMIVAPTGAGKSTRYVIPNLLTLDDCSFVVTDPS